MSQIKNAQIRYRVIDRCLRNEYKPYPSKEELRQACEEELYGEGIGSNICDSTIEKDLFAMRMDHDAPIKYSKSHKGYFYEDKNYSLDNLPLTEDDIEAIKFASKTLMQYKDVHLFKQFSYAIDKIFNRITISNQPNDSVDQYMQFETVYQTLGEEFLSDILQTIKEKQLISFDYTSYLTNSTKNRKVLPLLLKEYRNRWYVLTYSPEKEKIITFGLDRISNFVVLNEYLKSKIQFNSKNYFKYAIGITSYEGEPETIEFKIDKVGAKYIESQPLHHTQKLLKEGKNKNTYQLKVYLSEELRRLILSYGKQIEVVQPANFREEIKNEIQRLNEIYS